MWNGLSIVHQSYLLHTTDENFSALIAATIIFSLLLIDCVKQLLLASWRTLWDRGFWISSFTSFIVDLIFDSNIVSTLRTFPKKRNVFSMNIVYFLLLILNLVENWTLPKCYLTWAPLGWGPWCLIIISIIVDPPLIIPTTSGMHYAGVFMIDFLSMTMYINYIKTS